MKTSCVMSALVLTFGLSLIFSSSVLAQNLDSKTLGYSENNRQDKKMIAYGQVAGLAVGGTWASGVTFGYYLNPGALIEVDYRKSTKFLTFEWGSDYRRQDIYSVGAHYKQFFSNTIYMKFGGNYRKVDYDYRWTSSYDGTLREQIRFVGSAVVASIAFGNQWQWKNFTMGCDWVGIEMPLSNSIDSESFAGTYGDQKELEHDRDRFLKNVNLTAVSFYLGASF